MYHSKLKTEEELQEIVQQTIKDAKRACVIAKNNNPETNTVLQTLPVAFPTKALEMLANMPKSQSPIKYGGIDRFDHGMPTKFLVDCTHFQSGRQFIPAPDLEIDKLSQLRAIANINNQKYIN